MSFVDKLTGLEWFVSQDKPVRMSWRKSHVFCDELDSSWRMPTSVELVSLMRSIKHRPEMRDKLGIQPDIYWVSNRCIDSFFAQTVNSKGARGMYNKKLPFYVLPVREHRQ